MPHVVHDYTAPRLGYFLGVRVCLWHGFGRFLRGGFGRFRRAERDLVRRSWCAGRVLVCPRATSLCGERACRRAGAHLGRLTRQRRGRAVAEEGGQWDHRLIGRSAVGVPSVAEEGEVAMDESRRGPLFKPLPPPRLRLSAPKRREARRPIGPLLYGQRQRNRQLWRRLARASSSSTRGSGWAPSGLTPLPWECRAAQSHQARSEEPQEPSSGATKRAYLTTQAFLVDYFPRLRRRACGRQHHCRLGVCVVERHPGHVPAVGPE